MNRLLYPGFQIDNGKIRPVISQLLTLGKEHEESEADIIFWLCSPTRFAFFGSPPSRHVQGPAVLSTDHAAGHPPSVSCRARRARI